MFNHCDAAIYVRRDAQGNLHYSDQPSPGAKKLKLPPSNVIRSPKSHKIKKPPEVTPPPVKGYEEFSFVKPTDGETFHNLYTFSARFKITPELMKGDQIILLLDGKPYDEPSSEKQINFGSTDNPINPGTHTLQAKIINKDGKILKQTKTITIYIHYGHIGGKKKLIPISPSQ